MNSYTVILGNSQTNRSCFVIADSPQEAIIKAKEKYRQEENLILDAITVWEG